MCSPFEAGFEGAKRHTGGVGQKTKSLRRTAPGTKVSKDLSTRRRVVVLLAQWVLARCQEEKTGGSVPFGGGHPDQAGVPRSVALLGRGLAGSGDAAGIRGAAGRGLSFGGLFRHFRLGRSARRTRGALCAWCTSRSLVLLASEIKSA
jgi:hypothetical protein